MRTLTRIFLLALFAPVTMATAQDTRDPWAPFVGCWTPATSTSATSARCIVPGETAVSVDIIDVRDGESAAQSTLMADGERHDMAADGCAGWEMARFSDDGARLYISAEMTCDGGPLQESSGIFSISPTGAWIDVNGVEVGAQHSVQVRRSNALQGLTGMPADIRDRIEPRQRAYSAERIAASVGLSVDRVIDASHAADAKVVEAWIVESSRDAEPVEPVTATELEQFASAGVPDEVVDVMVALSYPESFQVAVAPSGAGQITSLDPLVDGSLGLRSRPGAPLGFDPLLMGSECAYLGYGWGSTRDRFNCSAFGYGALWSARYGAYRYGSGYGYGGYGYGYGYPGYPVIIVQPSNGGGSAAPRGRVVKGGGYRRPGSTSSDQVARPRSGSSTAVRSSGGSSTSRAGRKAGSSSSTEKKRTAKPRKP